MALGARSFEASDMTLTVVAPDQPGLFASVAGVLSVHGLDILGAEAHSDEQGMAASRFHLRIAPLNGWSPVTEDLAAALDGHFDIDSRLRERAATYGERRRESALGPQPPIVRFDDAGSSNATVVEVHAPDRIGLLRAITKVIAEQRLDIRHARITTLGDNVIDTFYLCTAQGEKLVDAGQRARLYDALLAVMV
jgi:[protein-PII] uridylyltransferase